MVAVTWQLINMIIFLILIDYVPQYRTFTAGKYPKQINKKREKLKYTLMGFRGILKLVFLIYF